MIMMTMVYNRVIEIPEGLHALFRWTKMRLTRARGVAKASFHRVCVELRRGGCCIVKSFGSARPFLFSCINFPHGESAACDDMSQPITMYILQCRLAYVYPTCSSSSRSCTRMTCIACWHRRQRQSRS